MFKAYKYRLYPNEKQKEQIIQHVGSCRFIYNWALDKKIKMYNTEGKHLSRFELQKELVHKLKKENEWLNDINAQSLLGALINLESAFTGFFRKKGGFPKFKSKKNTIQSFHIPQNCKVDFQNNTVKLPKIKQPVKARLHRKFNGKTKTATISMTRTGKIYISILVDDEKEQPEKQSFDSDSTTGIDVGLTHFATLSNGEKIDNPRLLKNSITRLKVLQKRMSKKKKGSNNRNKARLKVAKQHEKIANQRKDFLHKLSHRLISENQAIAIETLNVTGLMKNHHLAQAISDVSWGEFFRMLEYKAEWHGKTLLRIGQFKPSSKICNVCGHHNHGLTLANRKWHCPGCDTLHDRDINAALNIKNFALQKQNLIMT